MLYTSDKKILELYHLMKTGGHIRFDHEFYQPVGMTKQQFASIKNQHKYPERQSFHFTPDHIEQICIVFGVDANYIFGFTDVVYKAQKSKGNMNGNIRLNNITKN